MTRGIVGFYKSVYTNGRGEKVPIATSKFQPTYARRAFPCFDEPSFKSTFTVTLVRPSDGYIALSNMPVKQELSQQPSRGLTEVQVKYINKIYKRYNINTKYNTYIRRISFKISCSLKNLVQW